MINSGPPLRLPRKTAPKRGFSPGVTVLVTGFGPFPEVPFNASATLVAALAETMRIAEPRARLFTAMLPTDWRQAPAEAMALIDRLRPDVVLHFGVSRRAEGFEIETRAVNAARPAPDCTGRLPRGYHVRPGGPPVLASRLPATLLVRKLRAAGIAAAPSRDAGRYICNAVLYQTLFRAAALAQPPLAGFIHIPALPAVFDAGPASGVALGWPALERGARIIIDTMAVFAVAAKRRGLETSRQIG